MMAVVVWIFAGAAIAGACLYVLPLVRARNRRSLTSCMYGMAGDASAVVGFSLLCSGVRRSGQIENLLSSEYARCEVIVVADAWHRPVFFESLVARYKLIRVEYLPADEFPVHRVRSMWRSRKRCFRRLVLLDCSGESPEGDFDAAASVATYDWLIPVRNGRYLLPGALERLAVEVGQSAPGSVGVIRSRIGEPFVLFSREAVVAAGGFGRHPERRIPRRARRRLWEPFFWRSEFRRSEFRRSSGRRWRPWVSALLVGGIAAAGWTGRWALVCVLLMAAVGWCAAACGRLLSDEMAGRNRLSDL
ncbi:MAG: hypothetical protein NC322_05405 [Alistipes senegalensis]|nr:hypothetical protein [Alistipes senegalensis]